MNFTHSSNPEHKSVEKFYSRIRSHLDYIEPLPEHTKRPITERLERLPQEEKYGVIELKELELLLSNYDETSDKPTKCDRGQANSFAKLLYSKPGFHHPSSTDYLVEDLNIKEGDRDSFLGGHSTYAIPEENSIAGVTRHYTGLYIKNRARELLELMDSGVSTDVTSTLANDVQELFNMDQNNGNALVIRGKHYLMKKKYKEAVNDLRRALELNCDYIEQVRLNLSEAIYQIGMELYTRRIYDQASFSFHESLMYNPEHGGSQLHASMCTKKIQETNRRYGHQADTFAARRR